MSCSCLIAEKRHLTWFIIVGSWGKILTYLLLCIGKLSVEFSLFPKLINKTKNKLNRWLRFPLDYELLVVGMWHAACLLYLPLLLLLATSNVVATTQTLHKYNVEMPATITCNTLHAQQLLGNYEKL